MSSESIGSLIVNLEANMARFETGMAQAERVAESAMNGIQNITTTAMDIAKSAVIGLAAAFTVDAFTSGIKGAIDAAAALADLSLVTGVSVESLSKMQDAAKLTGTTIDTVGNAMSKLAKAQMEASQGGEKTAGIFKSLNIEFSDSKGNLRDSGEVLQDIAKKMALMENGTQRAAYTQELLGRSSATLMPFLFQLAEAGELQAAVTAQQANEADRYADSQDKLAIRNENLTRTIAFGLTPVMGDFNEAMLDSHFGINAINKELKKLVDDGYVELWANRAVEAIIPVMDMFEAFGRVVKVIGRTIAADAASVAIIFKNKWADNPDITSGLSDIWDMHEEETAKILGEPLSFRAAWDKQKADRAAGIPDEKKPTFTPIDIIKRGKDEKKAVGRTGSGSIGKTVEDLESLRIQKERAFAQDFISSIQKETDSMVAQNMVLEMSTLDRMKYNITAKESAKLRESITSAEKAGIIATEEAASGNAVLIHQRFALIEELTAKTKAGIAEQLAASEYKYNREREFDFGARKALMEYGDMATNQANNIAHVTTNAFQNFENAIVSSTGTSAQAFQSMIDSMVSDLKRLAVREGITGPLAKFIGGMFGGGGETSVLDPIEDYSGISLPSWLGGARAKGGSVSRGKAYLTGEEGPEWFIPSESGAVLPNGMAPGGGGIRMQMVVNVHEAPGTVARVQQSTGTNGTPQLDVFIDMIEGAMTRNMARGNGLAQVMEGRYGLNPAGSLT